VTIQRLNTATVLLEKPVEIVAVELPACVHALWEKRDVYVLQSLVF